MSPQRRNSFPKPPKNIYIHMIDGEVLHFELFEDSPEENTAFLEFETREKSIRIHLDRIKWYEYDNPAGDDD